jgi:RIP metalloprotease RseP
VSTGATGTDRQSSEHPEPSGPDPVRERADLAGVIGSPLGRALRLGALVGLVVLLGVTQGVSMLIVVASIVVMIFLHELGHFVMARRAGMLVTEFFIGFGPRIWSFTRGETEYGIKAIPAGAYVRIIGMSNLEEVDPSLEARTYRQGSFSQRLGVAVAGSAMHFLLALVLLFVQFSLIGAPDGERWSVGEVAPGSAAEAAGLRTGDRIVELAGSPVDSFADFRELLPGLDAGRVELTVVRDGSSMEVPVDLSRRVKVIGTIGEDLDVIDNGERLLLGEPRRNGELDAAGVRGGTTLLRVDDQPVRTLEEVRDAVTSDGDGTFSLTVAEDGVERVVEVDLGRRVDTTEPTAFVGVGSQPVLQTRSIPAAAVSAVETFGRISWASIEGVGRFLWPPNLVGFVVDAVSGGDRDATSAPTAAADSPSAMSETRPISIVGVALIGSDLTQENLASLVLFLAGLNVFIGIFNLFPLLPFDGGHVVIACYEKAQELRRRSRQRYLSDVSRMMPVAYGVIMVLGVVFVLAIYMDLTRGVSF